MDDQIELLVEVYSYWRDRMDFHRESVPARVAETECEVARLQQELKALDSCVSFDDNGTVRWPYEDEA